MIVIENEFMEHPDITLIPNDLSPEEAKKYAKVVEYPKEMSLGEITEYVRYFEVNYPQHTEKAGIIKVGICKDDPADIDLEFFESKEVPFQRIRRITGYLVGTLDRFNDAKYAEVKDRKKHSLTEKE